MIVRDNVPAIARCLASVRPLIAYWIIADTGATDDAPGIIRKTLHGIPGELLRRPWINFAHNRNEVLDLARSHGEYTLVIDATERLDVSPDFEVPFLDADSYTVEICNGEQRYWRPQLLRSSRFWRYEGVLHEFLTCGVDKNNQRVFPENLKQKRLPDAKIRVDDEAAPLPTAERFSRDAAVLETALSAETDSFLRARYKFYLAQSYLNAGDKEKALAAYQERAMLGFWDQEVFISLYRSADLKSALGFDDEDVIASYLRAHDVRKDRAEALYGAAHYCRTKQKYQQAFDLIQRALAIKPPDTGLFLEDWVYRHALLDEFAVNAYWIGRYEDCLAACERLLREESITADMRERIEQNALLARDKLSLQQMEASKGAPKALCLNMIVKNEMENLERCLSAVAPYIACWVIGDTGSTDGTQDFIRSFFGARGIPGELHSFPFEHFEQARNEALGRARASDMPYDYLLFTDADMEFRVQDPTVLCGLTCAAYQVIQYAGVTYWNTRLLRRDAAARYRGVTHEYVDVRVGETGTLHGVSFADHRSGANRGGKFERAMRLLPKAIATEPDPRLVARYTFYLANTLRDGGQKEAALSTYLKRASLGYWRQEVFMSLLNAAELKEALQYPDEEIIDAYISASNSCPTRAEALYGAARFCRGKGLHQRGYEFAAKGLTIAYPRRGLFVRDWIYNYALLDELALTAYATGRYAKCATGGQSIQIVGGSTSGVKS